MWYESKSGSKGDLNDFALTSWRKELPFVEMERLEEEEFCRVENPEYTFGHVKTEMSDVSSYLPCHIHIVIFIFTMRNRGLVRQMTPKGMC